jgi:fucose 4-O-acetylase-like acetyltransferase
LILGAHAVWNLPGSVYKQSEFWLNSPALVLIKLGIILFLMAFAFAWNSKVLPQNGWNWLRQLGTTSLLVYWVHIELVYGRWFGLWKENLTAPQTIAAAAGVIALMVLISVAQTEWARIREWFSGLGNLGATRADESVL